VVEADVFVDVLKRTPALRFTVSGNTIISGILIKIPQKEKIPEPRGRGKVPGF
jgi:hypothetical protein